MPEIAARTSGPAARYYARVVGADEAAVRRHLEQLPTLLDHSDGLLADGALVTDPLSAAALQVLSSVRSLDALTDLAPLVSRRPSATAARQVYPPFSGPVPSFIPAGWTPSV